jgi:hypothetical protein
VDIGASDAVSNPLHQYSLEVVGGCRGGVPSGADGASSIDRSVNLARIHRLLYCRADEEWCRFHNFGPGDRKLVSTLKGDAPGSVERKVSGSSEAMRESCAVSPRCRWQTPLPSRSSRQLSGCHGIPVSSIASWRSFRLGEQVRISGYLADFWS